MKIQLQGEYYITDEGTGPGGKCKIDYIWIGSDDQCVGYVADSKLKKLKKAVDNAIKRRKARK